MLEGGFRLGPWRVLPEQNRIESGPSQHHLRPRLMQVLLLLAERAGEAVSRDDFGDLVWHPSVVTDNALTSCISELRRLLDDERAEATCIETIPKRGYRLTARIEPLVGESHGSSTQRPSIAVLPFDDLGGDSRLALADAMHHELLTLLARHPDLRVISAASVRRYRNTDKPPQQIAAELTVEFLLEGSVQQHGDRVRVNAQLINAGRDAHLWARAYQRDLSMDNLFAVQVEITREIAESLKLALLPEAEADQQVAQRPDFEVYARLIEARTLIALRNLDALERACEILQEVTDNQPEIAEAWSGFAKASVLLAYYGAAEPTRLLACARTAGLRALDLNSDDPDALTALGIAEMRQYHNGPRVMERLERAWRLAPGVASGWYGWALALLGDLETGLARLEEKILSDPASPGNLLALAMLQVGARNPERALILIRRARRLSPGYLGACVGEAQALMALDEPGAALTLLQRTLEWAPDERQFSLLGWLAIAAARAGDAAGSDAWLARVRAGEMPFAEGLALTARRDYDGAVAAFQRVAWDDMETQWLRWSPFLDELAQARGHAHLIDSLNHWWGIKRTPWPQAYY
jgi:TolB-like protein